MLKKTNPIPISHLLQIPDDQWHILPQLDPVVLSIDLKYKNKISYPILNACKDAQLYVLALSNQKNNIIQFIIDKPRRMIIDYKEFICLEMNYEKYHSVNQEEIRILNAIQKNIKGVTYEPILCAKEKNIFIYLCVSHIQDKKKTCRIVGLFISLNSDGYYEIQEIYDLMPYKQFT